MCVLAVHILLLVAISLIAWSILALILEEDTFRVSRGCFLLKTTELALKANSDPWPENQLLGFESA